MTDKYPRGRNISLQFTPLACYVIAQQRPCLVRPSLTNTGEQRGRGGLTNITISSQVACDHHKVFRAELVSTPPDGLDTNKIFIISAWLGSVMIDYSCNYTSWESNGQMVKGKKIQMFWPNPGPSSVNNDLEYTLPCTLDHYSLKRALDWAETSEFFYL